MVQTNSIYTGLPTTIFETMSRLAREHNAINLGQGFPDTDGPEDVRRIAAEAGYCNKLTIEAGVMAVPLSAFYASDAPTRFIRFCFAKRDEVLDEAVARLAKFHRGAAA